MRFFFENLCTEVYGKDEQDDLEELRPTYGCISSKARHRKPEQFLVIVIKGTIIKRKRNYCLFWNPCDCLIILYLCLIIVLQPDSAGKIQDEFVGARYQKTSAGDTMSLFFFPSLHRKKKEMGDLLNTSFKIFKL